MPQSRRLLFHVQHLLGIGHLRRAALLVEALIAQGFAVTVAQGGVPSDLISFGRAEVVQLPAIRSADQEFGGLVDVVGQPLTAAAKAVRRDALLALFDRVDPAIVLLESFPFGRRQMRFELLPLLDRVAAAEPRPRVAVSVRDILQRRAPKRERETVDIISTHVDRVLVHGDPALVGLHASFDLYEALDRHVRYTGYVAPPPPVRRDRDYVLVSAGGGAVGANLLLNALAARPMTHLGNHPWLLVAGPNFPQAAYDDLRRTSPDGVTVMRTVPDLPSALAGAIVSVSQAGYNTVMDIAVSNTPSVLVPFAGTGETEQPMRAERLSKLGLAQVVSEEALDPTTLAKAIDRGAARAVRWPAIALDGARTSARLLADLADG